MKYLLPCFAATLFLAGASFAQSKDTSDECQGLSEKAAVLVRDYRALRDRRRQLPQGQRAAELDDFNGRLHEVLSALGRELGHPPFTRQAVVKCLGEPDAVRTSGRMRNFLEIYNRELRKAGRRIEPGRDRQYLIYFWRGWHDFLFYVVEDGVIVDHGWWFAYE